MASVDPKLVDVMCRVLGEKCRRQITRETKMEDIETWDSLTFVDLLTAVEEAFLVEIPPERAAEMISVEALQKFLEEKAVLSPAKA